MKVPPGGVERSSTASTTSAPCCSIDQSAQDVTDQLVDLDVRIANARQSVTNVRGFMDRDARTSTELVTLEAELTRRQTELEQLEAAAAATWRTGSRCRRSRSTSCRAPRRREPAPTTDDGIG